jgi:hypothetical protein
MTDVNGRQQSAFSIGHKTWETVGHVLYVYLSLSHWGLIVIHEMRVEPFKQRGAVFDFNGQIVSQS